MKLPVIVPVRDRLLYLLALLEALELDDHAGQIHLVDMASTYPELLAELRRLEKNPRIKVHWLGKNLGARGLFREAGALVHRIAGPDPFVLTDPDVVPMRPCIAQLLGALRADPRRRAKVGCSLEVQDLPEHYPMRQRVQTWEARHWIRACGSFAGSALYDADVATTFCVVRSLFSVDHNGNGSAMRLGRPFTARHLPWYEDPARLPADVRHYYEKAPRRAWGAVGAGYTWTPAMQG